MSELKLEEKKILSLRILKYIDKCCRDNELKYSLGYGSLLGAIRHKGFIHGMMILILLCHLMIIKNC